MTHISENAQDAKRHMDEVLGRIRPRLAGFTEEQRLIVGESLMCELANVDPRFRENVDLDEGRPMSEPIPQLSLPWPVVLDHHCCTARNPHPCRTACCCGHLDPAPTGGDCCAEAHLPFGKRVITGCQWGQPTDGDSSHDSSSPLAEGAATPGDASVEGAAGPRPDSPRGADHQGGAA